MTIIDSRFEDGTENQMDISSPVDRLPAPNVNITIVATFSDGSPAITLNKPPGSKGYGIAYAFFPGFHYQQSTNWDRYGFNEPSRGTALPYGCGNLQRDIITAPSKIANTPRPITLTQNGKILEMVEASLLESDKGIVHASSCANHKSNYSDK
jgi:hypothetical protein